MCTGARIDKKLMEELICSNKSLNLSLHLKSASQDDGYASTNLADMIF